MHQHCARGRLRASDGQELDDSAEGEADVHAAEARATWVEGAYVHVIGNLRSFNETKHVVA